MRIPAYLSVPFAALLATAPVSAQTPYPDLTIQDLAWTEDIHLYTVTQPILSPASPDLPVTISEAADAEFVSSNKVRLRPGFHAGDFGANGRFRAHIDETLGPPGDVVIIAPDPSVSMEDNVIHVPKWEKVEIGVRLPSDYLEAINRFFDNYYSDPANANVATSANVDPLHDLNPYADDSLQLVMTLTSPSGSQRLQWGFFMREAKWASNNIFSSLTEDLNDVHYPYTTRFRFAPDEEGLWLFTLSINGPYTQTLSNQSLPNIALSGYTLQCEPPLSDNKGPLHVNQDNRRILQFETGEAFFGIGPNLSPNPIGTGWNNPATYSIRKGSFDNMISAMDGLNSVGGNFMRTFLGDKLLAHENVNIGVYDKFRDHLGCAIGNNAVVVANAQHQAWVMDQILNHARAKGIYLQLCATPYPPIIDYETFTWHNDAYLNTFVEQTRHAETGNYDMAYYFYRNGDPNDPLNATRGPYYFWKRRYKYLMSRWGYSVNMPIIEHFNEIDQMLTYNYRDLRPGPGDGAAICAETKIEWLKDNDLAPIISEWISDIGAFIKGSQNLLNPTESNLGMSDKLILMSFTGGKDAIESNTGLPNTPPNTNHFLPFTNPAVDLLDVHLGFFPELQDSENNETEPGFLDRRMYEGYTHAQQFWETFPSTSAPLEERKPFNQGEFNHYTAFTIINPLNGTVIWEEKIEGFFHNYEVSFHNELWMSAFSGKFAAGSSWLTSRIFWWSNALPMAPADPLNLEQLGPFTNAIPGSNNIDLGLGEPIIIPNRRIYHHLQPLAALLNRPSVAALGILNNHFTPEKYFDDDDSDGINELEAYYLKSDWSSAIGWVHNRSASIAKNFYVRSGPDEQNFLGCTTPTANTITLSGFFSTHAHYVTWFPTRTGSTALPSDTEESEPLMSSVNGDLVIDLTGQFNGVADNYLDTLHSDYAFVITPQPFFKSLNPLNTEVVAAEWDFLIYPNPTREFFTLLFGDEAAKEVTLYDVSGRQVWREAYITTTSTTVSARQFAPGVYWVHVATAEGRKIKKVIIH